MTGTVHKAPKIFYKISRLRVLQLLCLLVLTVCNILLCLKLLYNTEYNGWGSGGQSEAGQNQADNGKKDSAQVQVDKTEHCNDQLKSHQLAAVAGGRFDQRRLYKIHDGFVIADSLVRARSSASVCLATQTSLDQLSHIVLSAKMWMAPLSVSVFAPDVEFEVAVLYMTYLRTCHPLVRANVTFSLVYPVDHPPVPLPSDAAAFATPNCSQSASEALALLMTIRPQRMIIWRQLLVYPQNLMRNVARKSCQADYVILTDVDVVARPGLATMLDDFLYPLRPASKGALSCKRCAYILPAYEVHDKEKVPSNKTQLLDLVRRKRARPFHQVYFVHNQYATNRSRWESLTASNSLAASYKIDNYEFLYEPFYLAKDDVPPHDERFVGYGFTRNTQVYEMYIAGYDFWVLNEAYVIHRGLKSRSSTPRWRQKQIFMNSKLLDGFKKEVHTRYAPAKAVGGATNKRGRENKLQIGADGFPLRRVPQRGRQSGTS